jgi:hypothetical protein
MADPFNYQMQVKSPFEAAVQGYALGEQINAATAQREANLAQQQVRQLQAMEVAQKIREAQALREEGAAFQQEAFALAKQKQRRANHRRAPQCRLHHCDARAGFARVKPLGGDDGRRQRRHRAWSISLTASHVASGFNAAA